MASLGSAPGRIPTVGGEIRAPAKRTSVPSVPRALPPRTSVPSVRRIEDASSGSSSSHAHDPDHIPLLLGLGLIGLAFMLDVLQMVFPSLALGIFFGLIDLGFLKIFKWVDLLRKGVRLTGSYRKWILRAVASLIGVALKDPLEELAKLALAALGVDIVQILFTILGLGLLYPTVLSIFGLVIFGLIFAFRDARFWTRWQIGFAALELVPLFNYFFFWTAMAVSLTFGWRNLWRRATGGARQQVRKVLSVRRSVPQSAAS